MLHRDLKTENILFDAQGYCLLADMGLAVYCPVARAPLCAHLGEPHSHSRVEVRQKTASPMTKPLPAASTWSENPVDITGGNATASKYDRPPLRSALPSGVFFTTPTGIAVSCAAHSSARLSIWRRKL